MANRNDGSEAVHRPFFVYISIYHGMDYYIRVSEGGRFARTKPIRSPYTLCAFVYYVASFAHCTLPRGLSRYITRALSLYYVEVIPHKYEFIFKRKESNLYSTEFKLYADTLYCFETLNSLVHVDKCF